jgi:hypothetical protein
MGTDSVKLFNKALADQMLAAGRDPLIALGDEEIYVDYWGCYAQVFNGHPEGSVSSVKGDREPQLEANVRWLVLLERVEHSSRNSV